MTRVQKALQKEFSPKVIYLDYVGVKGEKIGGWIISKSFEGLDGMQRQKKVWNLFDKYLDEKDQAHLGVFLTFTPLEKKLAFDDGVDELTQSSKRAKKPVTTRGNGVMRRKATHKSKQTAAAR